MNNTKIFENKDRNNLEEETEVIKNEEVKAKSMAPERNTYLGGHSANRGNDRRGHNGGNERRGNDRGSGRDNFRSNFRERSETVSTISDARPDTFFNGVVKITRKAKPGPTVFVVTDGNGSIDAVTPEDLPFVVDDVVQIKGPVAERAGKKQIEIKGMSKSPVDFNAILDTKSEPKEREFSIKSKRFEKMKPMFYAVAKRLRRAVLDGQPIMIRHHADTDGISSGLAIEHSLEGLMKEIGVDPKYSLYRSPSKAPFYETMDMLRDISFSLRIVNEFGQKKPLIVVLDNGSTPEDLFAHRTLHSMGFEIVVIDHHNPVKFSGNKAAVDEYVQVHMNPYLAGLDSKTCAGMLCHEVGRLINPNYDEPILCAVSGISDRCDIQETEDYIALTGKSREELGKIGVAIDFTSYNIKFDAGEGLYEEFFKNQHMVNILNDEVSKDSEKQLQSTLPYVRTQEINGIVVSHIDLEKYTMRFKYPTAGKVIGLIHDSILEGKEQHPVISFGCLSDMIIVRANKPVFPVEKIINSIKEKFPHANADGGGHECAGAIRFVSAHADAILEHVKEEIKSLPPQPEVE